jgi:GTP-binding protein
MSASTCWSCHNLLRHRLRAQISFLQQSRRCASTNAKPSLSWYIDTTPSTSAQLEAAERFFLTHQPRKLWTATEWRKHNDAENKSLGLIPEVAFLGRSNVGKSSLLNALLISPALNYVGPRPGKTITMHAWAVSPTNPKTGGAVKGLNGDMETKCAVLDMPGYGHASRDDWGEEIMSYLKNRKQLKRAFVLVDGRHGLKSGDLTMLRLLRKQGIPAQVVVSKCDKTSKTDGDELVRKLWNDIQEMVKGPGLGLLGEVLVVGSLGDGRKNDTIHYDNMRGVHEVQWAVLRATGLDKYATNLTSQAIPKASTSPKQTTSEEGHSAGILTKLHNPPLQTQVPAPDQSHSQSPAPPSSEVPFSWPAKLRKPSSGVPEISADLPSPLSRTMKPMNAPALPSEAASSLAGQDFADLCFMLSPQSSMNSGTSMRRETHNKTPKTGFNRPRQQLVAKGISSVKGRQVLEYREQNAQPLVESHAARKSLGTSGTWTGSAVGGMADLEALSSRSARVGGRNSVKPTARKKGTQRVEYTEESSHDVLAKLGNSKPAWTGSAVGGMADLEAMMVRTSQPSGVGRKPLKQGRRRHG